MVRKYGKPVDMRKVNRNIDGILKLIDESKKSSEKFVLDENTVRTCCVVCGSKKHQLFLTVYDKYRYFECKDCGALTLEKYPSTKTMYSSEETENFDIYIDESVYQNRVNMIAKPKVDFVIEVLTAHKKESQIKSWIDIGCGGGKYSTISNQLKLI